MNDQDFANLVESIKQAGQIKRGELQPSRTFETIRFDDWEAEQLQDPEFQAAASELEPAYQIARLRILRGLTQQQLAQLVGTHQPSIARLENGRTEPSIPFLRRVAEALNAKVEIKIIPQEEVTLENQGEFSYI